MIKQIYTLYRHYGTPNQEKIGEFDTELEAIQYQEKEVNRLMEGLKKEQQKLLIKKS